jgi:thiol:disulfide interchange protein
MATPFRTLTLAFAAVSLLGAGLAAPAAAQLKATPKATFVLNADRTAYAPGTTARLAALVTIDHGWHVNSHTPTFEYLIPTELDIEVPAGWPQESVRYPKGSLKTFSFEVQPLSVYDGDVIILADLKVPAASQKGDIPLRGKLHYQACNDSQCLPPVTAEAKLALAVGSEGKPQNIELFGKAVAAVNSPPARGTLAATAAGGAGSPAAAGGVGGVGGVGGAGGAGGRGLWATLLLAVLGGLVLNVMPCVLPVLSLKIFGLVRSASHGRAEVTRGALATALGILTSFWALALAAVAARAAGLAVGWGVQFQRPGFVAFLALVVVLFCLNLWGLFEIRLPFWLARIGSSGPHEGVAGHFASGLFASLMATPCSAPFLGTAIGFALGQSAPVILAIFTALGFGMALPYLAVAAAPRLAELLPKPGNWMETVRGAMGFLLAGSAVWLFFILASQLAPERLALVQLSILGLALFVWLRHRAQTSRSETSQPAGARPRSTARTLLLPRLAAIGALATAIAGLGFAMSRGGEARTPLLGEAPAGLIHWQPFDRAKAEAIAATGKLVFVDVTADWCITCKVNERLVLDTPEVAAAFARHGVVPMRADWTNQDKKIARFLADYHRYGIPFYLLYRPGTAPYVFSELPSQAALLAVVQDAGSALAAAGELGKNG